MTRSAAAPRQRLPPVAAIVSGSDQSQTSFESASSKEGGTESVGGDAQPARVRWCAEDGGGGVDTLNGQTASVPASVPWHRLETQGGGWEADEDTAMEGDLLNLLSPAWRILLLSDGRATPCYFSAGTLGSLSLNPLELSHLTLQQ